MRPSSTSENLPLPTNFHSAFSKIGLWKRRRKGHLGKPLRMTHHSPCHPSLRHRYGILGIILNKVILLKICVLYVTNASSFLVRRRKDLAYIIQEQNHNGIEEFIFCVPLPCLQVASGTLVVVRALQSGIPRLSAFTQFRSCYLKDNKIRNKQKK